MEIWLKQKTMPRKNYEWIGKTIRKKIRSEKLKRTEKNWSEIATCEQKATSEKANYCSNAVFQLYFKIRAKRINAKKPHVFSLHFLFRRDQNHYSKFINGIPHATFWNLKKN